MQGIRKCLLLCLFWAPSLPALSGEAGPVWQVSDGDHQLFLGGTVHILAASDYPLPQVFDAAYAQSERLVFETDIGATADPAFQQEMLTRLLYPAGETIQDHLSASTARDLQA